MENIPGIAFFSLFVAGALFMLYRFARYGGLRGAITGARIKRTPGEVKAAPMGMMSSGIRVHILDGYAEGKSVAVEFFAKSPLSWQTMPVALSYHEAERLAALLKEAVEEARNSKGF